MVQPAAVPPPRVPRRRGLLLATAVVLAAAVTAGGVVVALRDQLAGRGPDGAVRGYLAALADSDAATALAYGTVPSGPRTLLTSAVLREQQRIAPITNVDVRTTRESGDRARVEARFTLAFADRPKKVTTVIGVHRTDGDWRLDAVAVATQIQVLAAARRATLAGAAVPAGTTLLFPGAVPLTLDTPYLRRSPDAVVFGAGPVTQVVAEVSSSGRAAARRALLAAVATCLRPGASPTCPLPDERYVPGSLRGTVLGSSEKIDVAVGAFDDGILLVTGEVVVRGSYRRLAFDNGLVVRRNTEFRLPFRARAFAVPPLRLSWDRPE